MGVMEVFLWVACLMFLLRGLKFEEKKAGKGRALAEGTRWSPRALLYTFIGSTSYLYAYQKH